MYFTSYQKSSKNRDVNKPSPDPLKSLCSINAKLSTEVRDADGTCYLLCLIDGSSPLRACLSSNNKSSHLVPDPFNLSTIAPRFPYVPHKPNKEKHTPYMFMSCMEQL